MSETGGESGIRTEDTVLSIDNRPPMTVLFRLRSVAFAPHLSNVSDAKLVRTVAQ
jgi:hypothetical protein